MTKNDGNNQELRAEREALQAQLLQYGVAVASQDKTSAAISLNDATAEALLRSSPAAVIIVDPQGIVMAWSKSATQIFGWTQEEVLGKFTPLFKPKERDAFRQSLQRYLAGENVINHRCTRLHKDGREIEISLSTGPIRDAQGNPVAVVGLLTPIRGPRDAEHTTVNLPSDVYVREFFAASNLDGIWVIDAHAVTTFVNERMAEMLGRTPEQMIGRSLFDFISPEDHPQVMANLKRRESGISEAYEFKFPLPEGGEIWTALRSGPVFNRDNQYVGAVAIISDITSYKKVEQLLERRVQQRTAELLEINRTLKEEVAARRKAEQALRESESRFRLLAENATDMISRHKPDGEFLYVSPSCSKLLGYQPDELLGCVPNDMFHCEDLPAVRKCYEAVVRDKRTATVECRFRRKDGSYIWFETISKAICDEDTGQVIELHCASRDITSRREAEDELRLVRIAIEQADEAVVITTPELDLPGPKIVYVNPAFTRMTGYTSAEVLGKTPRILQGQKTSRQVLDQLRADLSKGQGFEGETINYRKDGQPFVLYWHIAPVRDGAGRLTHWVAIQRDVTEQRELQARERQRQEELAHVARLSTMGEMASGMAHELNQPLAAISIYAQGIAQQAERGSADLNDIQVAAKRIAAQAQRASDIIRRLREFVRKREPKRSAANINQLVRGVVDLMESEIKQNTITVNFELASDLPTIMVDTVQIEQVILNLVRNAIEAMAQNPPRQRQLTLRTAMQNHSSVQVIVKDNGVGATDEQLDRLFEPFFTSKPQGMGMGLAISESIAIAHCGRLTARRNVDQGLRFTLTLPISTSNHVAAQAS